jgi:hypothetical protein
MSTSVGPNSQGESNLILAVDTADNANSYKGKPTTNLLKFIIGVYGENTGTYFKTHYYTSTQTVPRLGKVTVNSINVYNDYNGGSGVCCEQLFRFGETVYVSGSTLYTYSIIYRSATGYTGANMMYRYEYGASGYVTEAGAFNAGQQTSLGDGWYHAWGQFTTQASTTYLNTYFFIYEYATYNTIDIAAVMIVQGNYILPPEQFIPFTTTRSNTQGLLDLTGKSTLNLTNMSYDSNAAMVFDGASNRTTVSDPTIYRMGTNDFTLECVMKQNKTTAHCLLEARGSSLAGYLWVNNYSTPGQCSIFLNYGGNQYVHLQNGGYTATSTNQYYHMVARISRSNGVISFFVNGVQTGSDVSIQHFNSISPTGGDNYWVGGDLGGNYWYGIIPIFKHYNRALTSTEITQNYNQYKTRFNLS